jgi:hypothetical protein
MSTLSCQPSGRTKRRSSISNFTYLPPAEENPHEYHSPVRSPRRTIRREDMGYGSPHQPIQSEDMGYGSPHKPIQSEDMGYGSPHKPIQSEDMGYGSPHEPIQSEGMGYGSPHKPIQSEGMGDSVQSPRRHVRRAGRRASMNNCAETSLPSNDDVPRRVTRRSSIATSSSIFDVPF